MLIKEAVFTPSKITIYFFEMPEEEIKLNLPKGVSFEENFKWRPGQDSKIWNDLHGLFANPF